MKKAGINHVRLPVGYWALDIEKGEPWVLGSWDYLVKAVGWCKKHGIRVLLDFHGAPGSQNGNDHSGQSGNISFFCSDDNLNRSTKIVKQMAEWANGTEWRKTVTMIQLLNEPVLWGKDYHFRLHQLKKYYRMAYDAVRAVNDNVVVVVHDAFIGWKNWYYLRDDKHYWWIMLDTHLYQVFGASYQNLTCKQHEAVACKYRDKLGEASQKLWTKSWGSLACLPQSLVKIKQILPVSSWAFMKHTRRDGSFGPMTTLKAGGNGVSSIL